MIGWLAAVPGLAATDVAPTATEQVILRTLLDRVEAPQRKAEVPVPDVIRSLSEDVVKTFAAPPGSRYARVTIRIRTRHVHWRPDGEAEVWTRTANGTVGWYSWRWTSRGEQMPGGRHLLITADNTLMLDPGYTARNEKTALGRLANDVLLYHELLHGQLLINAMDNPAWRANLAQTGRLDVSARDADHTAIRRLERGFLEQLAGNAAVFVEPVTGSDGTFRVVAGQLPRGFQGNVSVNYQLVGDGNVRNLSIDLPRQGRHEGSVLIKGELIDPSQRGFFLAVLENPAGV